MHDEDTRPDPQPELHPAAEPRPAPRDAISTGVPGPAAADRALDPPASAAGPSRLAPGSGPAAEAGSAPRPTLIPSGEVACVWMQAGVLSYWLCDLERRCDACPLDAALRHLTGPAAAPRTEAAVPAVPPAPGPAEAPARAGADLETLLALDVPPPDPGLRYHPAHTWARLEGPDRVRIGLDHFATRIVGPLRSVILPHPGTRVRRGHPCAWLDQEGGTLTVLAPVSGTILGCNPQATTHPEVVSRDPQGQGWLIELQPSDLDADLNRLQDARLTRLRTAHEIDRWARRVRRELRHRADAEVGATLADGGVRVTDVGQLIGPRRRHAIAVEFLSPAGARK